ncbi:hypothetical protein HGRIS_001196 [Hohenbuehelia grisea]|uniref:Uncharacterized protein n=1 Tax=Hohenbuehelia grisea TaxID=104357 RepID=A0ABR3JNJ9_9AGAR
MDAETTHGNHLTDVERPYLERLESLREAHNELLRTTEITCADKLAIQSTKYDVDAALLKEQKRHMEQKYADNWKELQRHQEAFVGASVESQLKLTNQEALFQKLVEAQEARAESAEYRAKKV